VLRPITATVSFELRPTMSMFKSAITSASGPWDVGEVRASPQASLLTAHGHEHQGALGALAGRGERLSQLDHGHRARAIVVPPLQIESAPRAVQPSPALGVPM